MSNQEFPFQEGQETHRAKEQVATYEELLRQQEATNKRLLVLQQAYKAIDSATELQEVLEQILNEGLKTVETERGSLMLIESERLITKAQFGPEMDDPERKTMTFKVGEGIVGYVAETGQAVLCHDVLKDTRFMHPPEGRESRFRSLLAVPIISHEGMVLGVINADDPEVGHFDQTHKQLLSDMAGQFAAAIEKMVLVDTLSSLHQIFERITSVAIADRDLSSVLNEIAKNATEVLKIDVITIYQYDQAQGTFRIPPLMKGISANQRMETEVREGEAPWILVHKLKHNYYAAEAPDDRIMDSPERPPEKGPGFVRRESIKSSAGLLLRVGEEIVGVMFVNYRTHHRFLDREQQIIQTFANSAAIAIQDVRQWENLKRTQAQLMHNQEQLMQKERMSAIGTMASGIAHNLRNPLENILSSINLLEIEGNLEEGIPFKLEEMKNEVHRASNIINSLLKYVRPLSVSSTVDVKSLVKDALDLFSKEILRNQISVDESYLVPVQSIQGDPIGLKEVLVNILKNAIEAMPNGGTLAVKTSHDNLRVQIEIQDTGNGIPLDQQPHIFDPFFTTKEKEGSGIGIGLATSSEIVQAHQGKIEVFSEIERGSRFVVTLPIRRIG